MSISGVPTGGSSAQTSGDTPAVKPSGPLEPAPAAPLPSGDNSAAQPSTPSEPAASPSPTLPPSSQIDRAADARLFEAMRRQEAIRGVVDPDIAENIRLVNSVLTHGVLSSLKAKRMGIQIVRSANISAPIKDSVHVNVVLHGADIRNALYGPSRGGISVALERENDQLGRQLLVRTPTEVDQKTMEKMTPEEREIALNMIARKTEFTAESRMILSNRAMRSVLVIANLEDAQTGFIPIDSNRPSSTNISNLKSYAADNRKISFECELEGSLKQDCIRAIIVSEQLAPYKQFMTSTEKIYFAPTVRREASYYQEKKDSEDVKVDCPNYADMVGQLIRENKLGESGNILIIMHMMRSQTQQ